MPQQTFNFVLFFSNEATLENLLNIENMEMYKMGFYQLHLYVFGLET